MAKKDLINKLTAIVAGVFIVNPESTNDQLEQLEIELTAIPNFSESELAKAITHSINEEKKAQQAADQVLIEEQASKVADLEATISELNESLANAESNGSKVKTLKPTFKHKKDTYEVLSKCTLFLNSEYKEFSAQEIASSKEAQEILVETQSGVINKLED